jgi:hypothetical protein
VRAMAAGLTPARNDARMRFAVPSGNSSIPLVFVLRNAADWRCDDVPVAAAVAVSFLGPRLIAAIDLDGNCLQQPLKLGVVQVLERPREVAWQGDPRGRWRIDR